MNTVHVAVPQETSLCSKIDALARTMQENTTAAQAKSVEKLDAMEKKASSLHHV